MDERGVEAIKLWVVQKVENQINFVRKLKKHREKLSDFLENKAGKMENLASSIHLLEAKQVSEIADTIRGLEGTAGRMYFQSLSTCLKSPYGFEGRSMRPAKDSFNAFLNYAYGMLYSRIERSLMIAGLDPYLGYLHRDDYNQLSFVYDFIEPYRIYADETVFKLFSGKKINKSHTDEIPNGFTLNKLGKELIVMQFSDFMEADSIRYKGRNQTRANIIQSDAHAYANQLIKKNKS